MYSNPPMDYPHHTPSYHSWSFPPIHSTNSSFTTSTTTSFPSFPWEIFTPCYTLGSSSPNLYLTHGYSPHTTYSYPWNTPPFYPTDTTYTITSQSLGFNDYPPVSPQQYTLHSPPSPWNPIDLEKKKPRQLSSRVPFLLSVRNDIHKMGKRMMNRKHVTSTLKSQDATRPRSDSLSLKGFRRRRMGKLGRKLLEEELSYPIHIAEQQSKQQTPSPNMFEASSLTPFGAPPDSSPFGAPTSASSISSTLFGAPSSSSTSSTPFEFASYTTPFEGTSSSSITSTLFGGTSSTTATTTSVFNSHVTDAKVLLFNDVLEHNAYKVFDKIPLYVSNELALEDTGSIVYFEAEYDEEKIGEGQGLRIRGDCDGNYSAEFLATFCDKILKKRGSEKLSDEEIEETLEKMVKPLAYISPPEPVSIGAIDASVKPVPAPIRPETSMERNADSNEYGMCDKLIVPCFMRTLAYDRMSVVDDAKLTNASNIQPSKVSVKEESKSHVYSKGEDISNITDSFKQREELEELYKKSKLIGSDATEPQASKILSVPPPKPPDKIFIQTSSLFLACFSQQFVQHCLEKEVEEAYFPCETPEPLRKLRVEELAALHGKGVGKLNEWEKVYDYACYNDLGTPVDGPDYARPVIGGSQQFPYLRRGRTSRPHTKTAPKTESRLHVLNLNVYVPRDEQFGYVNFSDFQAYALKSVAQVLLPELKSLCDKTINEFDNFEDVIDIYEGSFKIPSGALQSKVIELIPYEILTELVRNDGEKFLKFPVSDVIKASNTAWRTGEEFAREILAGVNPVINIRIQKFPPVSKLDPSVYGDQNSSIQEKHIAYSLDGFTIDEAIQRNKLYILDHHDALMPYLNSGI